MTLTGLVPRRPAGANLSKPYSSDLTQNRLNYRIAGFFPQFCPGSLSTHFFPAVSCPSVPCSLADPAHPRIFLTAPFHLPPTSSTFSCSSSTTISTSPSSLPPPPPSTSAPSVPVHYSPLSSESSPLHPHRPASPTMYSSKPHLCPWRVIPAVEQQRKAS